MSKGDFKFIIDEIEWAYLQNAVKSLGAIDGNQAIMNALSKGIATVARKGRSNLASSNNSVSGNLKKSIRQKRVKKWMSVYGGFRKGKGGGNHAHLVDRGTAKRWTKKGAYRGSVSKDSPNTGTRFWTRAVETNGPKIMEKTLKVIHKEVDKIIRKRKR